ncbi:MAG: hypothetical protein ACLGIG_03130 [Actinomycetes bacterium]
MSETPAEQDLDGKTPDAPDVDQPDGGTGDSGRTPDNPDADQPDGGASA